MQKANWQIDWTVLHTLVQPSLDAWLITFSAVMILQHQNHCLLNLGGVSNWGMLYSSTTERIFIPSRPLVTETSARSVLIGHNFIECCLWRTLNSTHKGMGTPANPGDRFRPDEEGSIQETSALLFLPLDQHSH